MNNTDTVQRLQIKLVNRILDSVWTTTADIFEDGTAIIKAYSRDDEVGYTLEKSLPKGRLIEGEGRIVEGLEIDGGFYGGTYTVKNPQHIFSYR